MEREHGMRKGNDQGKEIGGEVEEKGEGGTYRSVEGVVVKRREGRSGEGRGERGREPEKW